MITEETHTEASIAIIRVMSVDNVRNAHNKSCTEPNAKNGGDPWSGSSRNPDQHQYTEGVSRDSLAYKNYEYGLERLDD